MPASCARLALGRTAFFEPLSRAGLLLAAGAALACACLLATNQAHADELSEVRAEIIEKLQEADELAADIERTQKQVEDLDDAIAELLADIKETQQEHARLQAHGSSLARIMYKSRAGYTVLSVIEDASSITEVINRFEMSERVLGEYDEILEKVRLNEAHLSEAYEQASDDKTSQSALIRELEDKQDELDKLIKQLKKREKELDVEQQARLAQAAAAAKKVAKTFETGTIAGEDAGEWRSGIASAYGGATDPITPNPSPTATGTVCDDWSVGVAVPMAWGPEPYYGLMVEISYGGQSIIAPVVDCGDMDEGRRDLDLQPGVFKAFGAESCDEWGLRTVEYRFL